MSGPNRFDDARGTIVDATLIAAPPYTKHKDGKRDPKMHQSKMSNDWHFEMTAHMALMLHQAWCIRSSARP